ncbi:hypothetical protein GCM10011342_29170 [Aquisalinus flavus]|uniref:Uncharacterized protein n=1 Tax=Aquisalinus flavus TaxID=1526572 RepID=A0A8J2Y8B7_9PROT|nr:hypothetical protein [Aquisalinus flavus]MBD0428103.1 hypothetical protein [Aquisalinus flavus]GGD18646.1 hypothetical protein GCM10011342_29170 [Aquisalinus flavus]
MFTRMMAGMAIAASVGALTLAPLSAHADDEGGYKLLASSVNDDKTWVVVDTATETTAIAEKKGGEVKVFSGAEAEARLAAVYDAMPGTDIVALKDGSDLRIVTADGNHRIKLVEPGAGDGIDVEVEKMLEKAGLDIAGDISVDTDDGQKVIVIKTLKSGSGDTRDVTVEVIKSGDRRSDDLMEMPAPPTPPDAPLTDEDGEKVTVKTGHKMVVNVDGEDGDNRSFTKMTGVSKQDAVAFIDDIEDLTAREKDEMKAALSL